VDSIALDSEWATDTTDLLQTWRRTPRRGRMLFAGDCMRIPRAVVAMVLVALAPPAPAGAETTVYFAAHAVSVPPPIELLVCGLALLSIGSWLRR
jgi:hypothetical protein